MSKPVTQKRNPEVQAIRMIATLIEKCQNYVRDISDFRYERTIGRGSYGEVWLANDLRTGKMCAVKEIVNEKLSLYAIGSFIREVQAMIILNETRFILPFVGFTVDAPYAIITEYAPNNSLLNYTHVMKQKAKLSGTHLAIDALCIAYAMNRMHKRRLIHRDLKAANVLLDKNYLPMICDFGTTRIVNTKKKMTGNIGTISNMAPEVLKGEIYGLPADVFSYGMLIFEMSQGHFPYAMKKDMIEKALREGQFPKFRVLETPRCLIDFMKSCWNNDPSKRPTFEEIYNKFRNGEVFFLDTQIDKVKKFAEQLEKLGNRKPNSQNAPVIDIQATLQRLKMKADKLEKELTEKDGIGDPATENNQSVEETPEKQNQEKDEIHKIKEILEDPDNALFIPTLTAYSEQLDVQHFRPFYYILIKHFQEEVNPSFLVSILNSFLVMAKRDHRFIEKFEEYHLFSIISDNQNKNVMDATFEIVWYMFSKVPNLVNHSLFRFLGMLLMNQQDKAIALFSLYASKYEQVDDPFKIFDFLLSYGSVFIDSKYGGKYIDIFYFLYSTYPQFSSVRLQRFSPILSSMCRSQNKLVALSAMKALALLYNGTMKIPYATIISRLADRYFRKTALSILKRVDSYPTSPTFFKLLIRNLPSSGGVILKFINEKEENAKLAVDRLDWMQTSSTLSIKIFLSLFQYHKVIESLMKEEATVSQYLAGLTTSTNADVLLTIGSLIKRLPINQSFIDKLTENSFFKGYFNTVIHSQNVQLIQSCNSFIDNICRVGYSQDYSIYVPFLMKLLASKDSTSSSAILLLVSLSRCQELIPILNTPKLVNYFNQLRNTKLRSQAQTFLRNISST